MGEAGIVSYGAYIPFYRLSTASLGWKGPGEKAVANFDEDSITMAVAAGIDCLDDRDRSLLDGLIVGSTTLPYIEKQAAAIAAGALDLPRRIRASDQTGSLRSGTIALHAAVDAAQAAAGSQFLVVAADCRPAFPNSALDATFGDGAAALLVGQEGVVAAIEDRYSHTDAIVDQWRTKDDRFVMAWEDRFGQEEGFTRNVREALLEVMGRNTLTPKDFRTIVLATPTARMALSIAKELGFERTQIAGSLAGTVGHTGCAAAALSLVSALDESRPGDRILLASYGDGCDVFMFQVTEEIRNLPSRRGFKGYLSSKRSLPSYESYLRLRSLIDEESARRPQERTSAPALLRDRSQILGLHGSRCRVCGTPQFPIQRVCAVCRAKDQFDEVALAADRGEVFTYTVDYLALSGDPPMVKAVVDLEGGARVFCEMTDRDPDDVRIGMSVEMTFRRVKTGATFPQYFWKCQPPR